MQGGRGSCPECMPRTCCPHPLAPATPSSRNHASRDTRPGAHHAHGGGKGRPVPSEPARAEAGWPRSHGSSPTQRRYDICPCVGGEEAEALDRPIHCHLVGTLQRVRALTRHWIKSLERRAQFCRSTRVSREGEDDGHAAERLCGGGLRGRKVRAAWRWE